MEEAARLSRSDGWEVALLQVSYELLLKFLRGIQKSLEKQLTIVVESLVSHGSGDASGEESRQFYQSQVDRLGELRARLDKARDMEQTHLAELQRRITFGSTPQTISAGRDESIHEWYSLRLASVLIDYLLRCGYTKTAAQLQQQAGLKELVNMELYRSLSKISADLEKHSCKEALKWCGENRSRLRKIEVRFDQ